MRNRVWIIILTAALAVICGCVLVAIPPLPKVPSFTAVRNSHMASEGLLLDRNGEIIHELRIRSNSRRLDWTPLEAVSPALQSAIIEAEDHRYYQHHGVDWISIGSALRGMLQPRRARGASTITMQLAALQDSNLRSDSSRRSLPQKWRQIQAARAYEKSWSKKEVLEAYLNLVTFRGELQGIAAASQGLFLKEPQGLNFVESAILGSLLRSPNAGLSSIVSRAFVLTQKLDPNVTHHDIEETAGEVFSKPYRVRPQIALAPHIARQLFGAAPKENSAPRTLSCTLDGRLQSFAAETLRQHVLSAKQQNMHDGSVLVVENRSGDVLAYVGNLGGQSSSPYVDGIRGLRQAGSTLKPFLYTMAFGQRLLTPASLIEDTPLDVPAAGGVYRPRNYDNRFHGPVTARVALASSLNVPAVKTLNLVGVDTFTEILRLLGFEDIRTAEFYGASLALGSADITLWNLVNAYRTLARGGLWSPLRITPDSPGRSQRQVLSPQAAFLISDILSDRESRSRTFELESPLSTRFWTAVKTGTSKDMRDNWCIGFSAKYTVGVWTGNFSGEPMWNVSGITGAAPIWVDVMNWLHRREPSIRPGPPADVVRQLVRTAEDGQTRQEWFIKGTETALIERADRSLSPRISYPAAGTVIALDPDIPDEDQRVFFESDPAGSGMEWVLDGTPIGNAAALQSWAPIGGKHILMLRDSTGRDLDTVTFEVR